MSDYRVVGINCTERNELFRYVQRYAIITTTGTDRILPTLITVLLVLGTDGFV